MAKTPQPPYRLIKRDGPFQIRAYEPMVLAETEQAGNRKTAGNAAFHILFDYISGRNQGGVKLPMTVPVTMQPTAETKDAEHWIVRFVMPPGLPLARLPRPENSHVDLFQTPVGRAAICRFSGSGSDASLKKHTESLRGWMKREQLIAAGPPVYAFYNSPFSLPFLRRNEVMIGIEY